LGLSYPYEQLATIVEMIMDRVQNVFARPVAETSVNERIAFLKRVYGWMTAALLMTVVGAAISIQSGITEAMMNSGFLMTILLFVAWIALAHVLQKVRHVPMVNVMAFAAYALFTGLVVSSLILIAMLYGEALAGDSMTYIYQALGLTVAVFGGLTIYTFFTKRDFSFLRGMLITGLIGILVLGLMNAFIFQSSGMAMAVSFFGVLLFSGFILYDTQKIMKQYPVDEHVAGAMTLFLNFVLLFMYMLRLVMLLSGRD
jgi:FtsH-binding integral membrane protein